MLLAGLWALGSSRVEGQSSSDDAADAGLSSERASVHDGLHAGPGVAGARCFFDGFSSDSLESQNWEIAIGVSLTSDFSQDGGPYPAVRLAADRNARNRRPELRSSAIDLSTVRGAELTYTVQHRGVEPGERLIVEYRAESGEWTPIENVVANENDTVGFSQRMRALPDDAMHAAFQVRFRSRVEGVAGAWYIGEVSIAGHEPSYALAVRVHPPGVALVEVIPEDGLQERLDGSAPFTRSLSEGTRVYLVAPPTVDELVFSHWTVDDDPQLERERVLTIEMSADVEVVAHYRPWVPGRQAATVTIASSPESGVSIALGTDPEHVYDSVRSDSVFPCLTGDWLALIAPARTARLIFTGWSADGQAMPCGETLLEQRVSGDNRLMAQYVLLGDMNGDGQLDKFDVEEFVAALIDPDGYAQQFPDLDPTLRGDVNRDGVFDALDIESFVDLLVTD